MRFWLSRGERQLIILLNGNFREGKLIPGETEEDCIIREMDEELSMEIVICGSLPEVEYDYGHKTDQTDPFYLRYS